VGELVVHPALVDQSRDPTDTPNVATVSHEFERIEIDSSRDSNGLVIGVEDVGGTVGKAESETRKVEEIQRED
jgi:hypothetical protein